MMRRALPFLFLWLAALPAHADDPQSFAVTTDTAQYCTQLAKQVGDRHSAIPDVQRLLETGTDMCAKGEIRGGIRRLRHALIILHHHRAAAGHDQAGRAAGGKEPGPKGVPVAKPGMAAAGVQKPADAAPGLPDGAPAPQ